MEYRKIGEVWVLNLLRGDEVIDTLTRWVEDVKLNGAFFNGLGASSKAVFGFYNTSKAAYEEIQVNEPVEVVSMNGCIAWLDTGKPRVHTHASVSRADGTVVGGHLISMDVASILEIIVIPLDEKLHKTRRPDFEFRTLELRQ